MPQGGIITYKNNYSWPFRSENGGKEMNLNLRPASECKYDAVSLGEVMLRLDPGEGRIR